MPANSPRISPTLLVSFILFFAALAQAQTYPDLFACEAAFKQQNAAASHDVMHSWCQSRVYSVQFNVDVCVEQKSFAAVPGSTTVSTSQRSQYQPACVTQVGSGSAGTNTASTGTGTGTTSTAAQVNPQTLPACQIQNPTPAQQQNCQVAIQNEQIRLAQVQQQQAQQAEQQRQQEQAQRNQRNATNVGMAGAIIPAIGQMAAGMGGSGSSSGNSNYGSGSGSESGSGTGATTTSTYGSGSASTGTGSSAPGATSPGGGLNANDVAAIDPSLAQPAKDVANSTKISPDMTAPETADIGGAGKEPGQKIQQSEQTAQQAFNQIQTGEVQFATWSQGVNKAVQEYRSYKTKHEACVKRAETAKHLCLESTSPGAKAAKTLVTIAGPLLAAMSVMKKTCGDTGKIMQLAQMGMLGAEAVCVGAKTMCDNSCAQAQQHLQNINTEINALQQKSTADEQTGRATCLTNHPIEPTPVDPDPQGPARETCYGEVARDKASAERINSGYSNLQAQLNQPENGTTKTMIAKCSEMTKDIALLAANAAGLLAASQGGKKCEKELASGSGAAGNTPAVAAQEYCSADATKDSQFCRCRNNSSGEGCSAILAAGPPTDTPADQRGTNLQNSGGPSAFAGGNTGGRSSGAGGYGGYSLGSDPYGTNQANLGTIASTMTSGSGAPVGALGGGGKSGSGATAGGPSDAQGSKKDDKNKWSFGSFASSVGSALGFSGGGSGSRSSDNAGTMTKEQLIERKLASDRYAAEISPSTGADNFSKIKRSYVQKADTFMVAP